MKKRLDVLLVEQGLADSREKAKAIIMSGIVYVDNNKEDKAGTTFDETAKIEVRGNTLKYVSRGGLKLEKAMDHFGVELAGKVCMDVGASTGGFTDCMHGSSEMTRELSVWRKQIYDMSHLRILTIRLNLLR